jgi:hypothetical protein
MLNGATMNTQAKAPQSGANEISFRKSAPAYKGYALYGRKDRAASFVALFNGQEVGEVRGRIGGGYEIFVAGKRVASSQSLKFAKLEIKSRLRITLALRVDIESSSVSDLNR